ncbi:MAG: hypothetical protein ACREER_09940 [Alphaproteobacteria bacterium]
MTWLAPVAELVGRLVAALGRLLPALLAYLAGRRGQRSDVLAKTGRIHEEQLRAAADRPRDRRELVRRLRSDGL